MATLLQYQTKAALYNGPFDSVVGWAAAGMGYVIKTDNGQLIVIDGGHAEDGLPLLATLVEMTNDPIPKVDLWILTHPHLDHYGAIEEIANNPILRQKIDVKYIVFDFPNDFQDRAKNHVCQSINADMARVCAQLNAKIHKPKTGEMLSIDTLTIRFLFTPEDPTLFDNINQLSLIFTIQTEQKRCMFTGDAYIQNLQWLVEQYREDLKCDILQMPHHGLCDTGLLEFYQYTQAKLLLVPTSIAGDRTMHSDMYGDAPKANLFAEQNALCIKKAYEGNFEISI